MQQADFVALVQAAQSLESMSLTALMSGAANRHWNTCPAICIGAWSVKNQSFPCKTVGWRLAIRRVKPAKQNTVPSKARSFAGWCCNTFYPKDFAESETLDFYTATQKKHYTLFSWHYASSSKLSSHAPGRNLSARIVNRRWISLVLFNLTGNPDKCFWVNNLPFTWIEEPYYPYDIAHIFLPWNQGKAFARLNPYLTQTINIH